MATLHAPHDMHTSTGEIYTIRHVETDAPFRWLREGLADMKKAPLASLMYGLVFAVVGLGMMALVSFQPVFVVELLTGFLLVGPFVAVGLYDLSRRIEDGEKPTLAHAFSALKFNTISLASFALMLGFIMIFWVRTAAILTGLFVKDATLMTVGWGEFFSTTQSIDYIISFTLLGLALAIIVFSISVVAIPMITHRKVDVITAMMTSLRAVAMNPLPMILWAGLIVGMIALGMAFFYIGLMVTLPIVGHASWHAYRELVATKP